MRGQGKVWFGGVKERKEKKRWVGGWGVDFYLLHYFPLEIALYLKNRRKGQAIVVLCSIKSL